MPHVRVQHNTTYRYAAPVQLTEHRLMLRPHDSHDLRLNNATLGLTPPAARLRWAHDVFGNSICFVDFGGARADTLSIVSVLDLDHYPALPDLPLDPAAKGYPFRYAAAEMPDLTFLIRRQTPDPQRTVDAWARQFLARSGPTMTAALLAAMTEAIKADFTYEARDTEGTNPPLVTLATRRGACRDLALLMMEAARALGFAARFISGYVYDAALVDSDAPVVGGGATHAWCSIYLPGAGWVEFDPTNGLIAGRNLIRVSVARTPEQAVPVSGGFLGKPDDFLALEVDVTVAVGDRAVAEAADAG
jgi:transglutaminase-like putative cysteine protease